MCSSETQFLISSFYSITSKKCNYRISQNFQIKALVHIGFSEIIICLNKSLFSSYSPIRIFAVSNSAEREFY